MEFELRVPCLEGLGHMSCEKCHICLNSSTALTASSSKPLQQSCKTQNFKITNEISSSSSAAALSTSTKTSNSFSNTVLNLRRVCTFLLLLNLFSTAAGCGPGRGIGGPRPKRKLTPLVFKQHVPNMSEQTLGASGISEGAINRDSAKFKKLEFNNNRDIIFKDEEGTGADHVMTRVST